VLADRIVWFAEHRSELDAMRPAAKAKALATGWSRYEKRIEDAVSMAIHRRRLSVCAS
jgi:hypothetical protein